MFRSYVLVYALISLSACGGDDDGGGGGGADAAPEGEPDGAPEPAEVEVTTYVGGALTELPLVAAQDGDGAWQLLDSDTGVYAFVSETGRYGVVTVCDGDGVAALEFYFATTAEDAAVERRCPSGAASDPAEVQISVAGLTGDAQARVSAGSQFGFATMAEADVLLGPLPPGTYDAWASVRPDGTTIESVMVERAVETAAGDTPQVAFDVDQDTVATTDFTLTFEGETEAEAVQWGAYLLSTNRTVVNLAQPTDGGWAGVPASALEGDDVHQLGAVATTASSLRMARTHQVDPGNVTLTLPPALGDVALEAIDTDPYVRAGITFEAYPDATFYEVVAQTEERTFRWEATAGWFAGGVWEQPDLGDLDGWTNGWALPDNVEISWFASAHRGVADPHLLDEGLPPPPDLDGVTHERAAAIDTFTP